MTRLCPMVLAASAAAALLPFDASAQTSRFSIGVIAGAAVVQHVGGAVGGEFSYTLTDRLDLFAEGIGMQDVVTRRRLNLVPAVANFLQSSQGKPATGELTAPAGYGGAGVRITLMPGTFQPYLAFSAGAAKVTLWPLFTLGGTDVTATLAQYGVQLGGDLTGETTSAAFGGGGGVRMHRGRWYVDGGLRLTSIRLPDEPTNVMRAEARVGMKF